MDLLIPVIMFMITRILVTDDTVFQIDMEEYGVALDLAWQYNLDSDLVYQRQWRNSPVSVTSIQDYLVSVQLRFYSTRLFYNC